MKFESRIIQYLIENKITVATAESCTGGLLAAAFTSYPGVSAIYQNGVITYSNEAKNKLLKVSPETLRRNGAVSSQVCAQMCFNLAKSSKCQLTLATTGVAGPGGGTKTKPVGLVYAGVCYQKTIYIKKLQFSSKLSRLQIQKGTVKECFEMIKEITDGL
jgi:PncC family amidohydrolase